MYSHNAQFLAKARAQDTTVGEYPLEKPNEEELKMWDWLKLNGYVKSPESRLLSRAHQKKSAKSMFGFPDMEMEDYVPYMAAMRGRGGAGGSQAMAAAMAYDMQPMYNLEEELLPFYYSSLINQATNNSIARAAANLPYYAMTDME